MSLFLILNTVNYFENEIENEIKFKIKEIIVYITSLMKDFSFIFSIFSYLYDIYMIFFVIPFDNLLYLEKGDY